MRMVFIKSQIGVWFLSIIALTCILIISKESILAWLYIPFWSLFIVWVHEYLKSKPPKSKIRRVKT